MSQSENLKAALDEGRKLWSGIVAGIQDATATRIICGGLASEYAAAYCEGTDRWDSKTYREGIDAFRARLVEDSPADGYLCEPHRWAKWFAVSECVDGAELQTEQVLRSFERFVFYVEAEKGFALESEALAPIKAICARDGKKRHTGASAREALEKIRPSAKRAKAGKAKGSEKAAPAEPKITEAHPVQVKGLGVQDAIRDIREYAQSLSAKDRAEFFAGLARIAKAYQPAQPAQRPQVAAG